VSRVGNTQASHAMSVTPFSKVTLESFWSLVCVISTNLTIVANIQAVQFVQPIWNGLNNKYIDKVKKKLFNNCLLFSPFHPNRVANS
jgi:hypothetical protein